MTKKGHRKIWWMNQLFSKKVTRKYFRGKWKVNFFLEMSAPGPASALYAHDRNPLQVRRLHESSWPIRWNRPTMYRKNCQFNRWIQNHLYRTLGIKFFTIPDSLYIYISLSDLDVRNTINKSSFAVVHDRAEEEDIVLSKLCSFTCITTGSRPFPEAPNFFRGSLLFSM